MRILLLAMPDTVDIAARVVRLPNLGVASLAGNLPGHEVKVLDLVLCRPGVGQAVREVLASFRPQLVGLSSMTFQFETLLRVARLVRAIDPTVAIAVGGYHATLMSDAVVAESGTPPFDFVIRGEGELTLRELAASLESGGQPDDLTAIRGLTFRSGADWVKNPDRPLADLATLALPDRNARLASGFAFLGVPFDVVETSRGCPGACKFCSITGMYGRTFRRFPLERVVEDIRRARACGARAIFITDDNITHDVGHLRAVCRAIVENGLTDLSYLVQVAAAVIGHQPQLVEEMAAANFRYAFVGFETMNASSLRQLHKPTSPELNRAAATLLRRHGLAVIAGIIVGQPDDTRDSLREDFRQFRRLRPDMFYAQYLTPYPGTPLRDELLAEGLVTNVEDFRRYEGFSCNVRTRHMTRDALHRALKWETLKYLLTPSHLWYNRLLRWHGRELVGSMLYTVASDVYNVVTARGLHARIDV